MRFVTPATLFAFLMACLWPYSSRAADAPAPPPPAGQSINDEALAQAKQHFEAGRNAYNAQDYITAIREFKAAEALRPSPLLAYNIGLANEKLGKRRVALKYYHRYLEQMPNAQNRPEVEGRIQQLEAEVASLPPPPPPGQAPPPGPNVEQPGDNPPPQPGSQRAHNENVKWEAVAPDIKAQDFSKGYEMGKQFVMGAAGPPRWQNRKPLCLRK